MTLSRSQSSREVRPRLKVEAAHRGRDFEDIREDETGAEDHNSSSPRPPIFKYFGLKRTFTMASVSSAVSNWRAKSFRQRLHERTQSFRNLDKNWIIRRLAASQEQSFEDDAAVPNVGSLVWKA